MRIGKSIEDLSRELLRVKDAKRDWLADTRRLTFSVPGGTPTIALAGVPQPLPLTRLAATQVAEHTGVPMRFFDRLAEKYPAELAQTVNAILQNEPATRMVRALDGQMRALLSNSYRPLDNDIAAEGILPALMQPGVRIESCELTGTKLYIKAVFTDRQTPVKVGDFVQAGVVFSNSEVGAGAFSLQPLIYRLACKNGAIMADDHGSVRAIHLGGKNSESEVREYFANDTRRSLDQTFILKVRDTIKYMASPEFLERMAGKMRDATEQKIEGKIEEVMDVTAKKLSLTDTERAGVLQQLAAGGDLTRFGLANAVTRFSQDVLDYDRATDLERLGGRVLELGDRDWNAIALAA